MAAKKNKLTLATAKEAAGVGQFVEAPVQFKDEKGEVHNGTILVKRLSHNERVQAIKEWGIEDTNNIMVDQVTRAYVFASIYAEEDEKFFPDVESTGDVSPEFVQVLFGASDKVNDFAGKSWTLNQKNSGASSSSTELAEEQLKKPNPE